MRRSSQWRKVTPSLRFLRSARTARVRAVRGSGETRGPGRPGRRTRRRGPRLWPVSLWTWRSPEPHTELLKEPQKEILPEVFGPPLSPAQARSTQAAPQSLSGNASKYWILTQAFKQAFIISSQKRMLHLLNIWVVFLRDILLQKRVSLSHTPDIVRVFQKETQAQEQHEFQKVRHLH